MSLCEKMKRLRRVLKNFDLKVKPFDEENRQFLLNKDFIESLDALENEFKLEIETSNNKVEISKNCKLSVCPDLFVEHEGIKMGIVTKYSLSDLNVMFENHENLADVILQDEVFQFNSNCNPHTYIAHSVRMDRCCVRRQKCLRFLTILNLLERTEKVQQAINTVNIKLLQCDKDVYNLLRDLTSISHQNHEIDSKVQKLFY
jgi:hypothetical protein